MSETSLVPEHFVMKVYMRHGDTLILDAVTRWRRATDFALYATRISGDSPPEHARERAHNIVLARGQSPG
jgi:hypothetical protein